VSFFTDLLGNSLLATSAIFILCLPVFLLGRLKLFNHIAIDLSFAFMMAFLSDVIIFPALQLRWNWLAPKDSIKPEMFNGQHRGEDVWNPHTNEALPPGHNLNAPSDRNPSL
jgi:hypothetical protein